MTSKERVKCAFSHKEPDKVPVDFGGMSCSTMNAAIVKGLRDYYGLENRPPKVNDMSVMTALIEPDLAACLGCDVQQLYNYSDTYGHVTTNWKEWTYRGIEVLIPADCTVHGDGNGGYYVYPMGDDSCPPSGHMPADGYYFDNLTRTPPFDEETADPEENAEEYKPVSDAQLNYHKTILQAVEPYHRAIQVGPCLGFGDANLIPGPSLKNPRGIRDIAEWYTAPLLYPDYVHAVFSLGVERTIANLQKYWEAFGSDIDIVYICGTDFGMQSGPMMSVETFKTFYLPYYRKVNTWVHENTTWKTLKHSCGGIFPLLPYIIESGFDAINPVQCSANGMEPCRLKSCYGKDILFWGGGVDTQKVLPFGTPEEVRSQVLERLEIFAKDGGYIFNTIHNIQPNTPIENIVAMIEAVKEFNGEP